MERQLQAPMLIDGLTADPGGPRTAAFLDKVEQAVDFEALATAPRADLAPEQPQDGRPFLPVRLMLRGLMLAQWFGLSDPQPEEQLRDHLSFRRFVDLSLTDATPDETSFVNFRKRLREIGHLDTLFEAVLDQLRVRDLVLKEGSLVDATIVEQARGGKDEEGQSTPDRCASYTRKHGRSYHGYKARVNVSKDRFITEWVFDTAKVHDSQHIDTLIEGETQAVYADTGRTLEPRTATPARPAAMAGYPAGGATVISKDNRPRPWR